MSQRPLRVLHVNTTDLDGGAARAAHRIHTAQRRIGVDSHMLVLRRRDADPFVHQPQVRADQLVVQRLRQAVAGQLAVRQKTPTNPALHSLNRFGCGLADWINRQAFDVVNLHWLGDEMLSVEEIARIRAPVCWTMHDMWPFSGAEHYDDLTHPGRYLQPYTAASRPPGYGGPDLDARVWHRKQRAWAKRALHLVSPSRWLAGCARDSALLGQQPVHVLPNCVDHAIYRAVGRRQAREWLGLDPAKRYILFGAMSGTSDPRKGFALLTGALDRLVGTWPEARGCGTGGEGEAGVELMVFGAVRPEHPPDFGLPVHYLGCFHDDLSLALLYAAADVLAAPSMQDNLPNTLVEALACGTPCVAFDIGGMPDLVEHGVTGWLAPPFEVDSFAQGLRQMLEHPQPQALREACRSRSLSARSGEVVARQYLALHESVGRDVA